MPKNYAPIVAKVVKIIAKYGRPLTVSKPAAAPADASKPWRGPGNQAPTTLSLTGVFSRQIDRSGTSEPFKSGSELVFVAPTQAGDDLSTFTAITDGTLEWGIDKVKAVQPGGTVVLWELTVSR